MEGDTLKKGAQGWVWRHRGHRKGQFSRSSPRGFPPACPGLTATGVCSPADLTLSVS